MKKIAISQPRYLPACNYIERMILADEFIILDNVQHQRRAFEHRNKIKTTHGEHWLSIPLDRQESSRKKISELMIRRGEPWELNHLYNFEQFYKKTPYFDEVFLILKSYYSKKRRTLNESVKDMLNLIIDYLDLNVVLKWASDYSWESSGTDLLIEITKKFSGDAYISGPNGRKYLDFEKFRDEKIKLLIHDYKHPVYEQLWGPFMPYMTIWDLFFYKGKEAKKIIMTGSLVNE